MFKRIDNILLDYFYLAHLLIFIYIKYLTMSIKLKSKSKKINEQENELIKVHLHAYFESQIKEEQLLKNVLTLDEIKFMINSSIVSVFGLLTANKILYSLVRTEKSTSKNFLELELTTKYK
jgi:hypothetical protein